MSRWVQSRLLCALLSIALPIAISTFPPPVDHLPRFLGTEQPQPSSQVTMLSSVEHRVVSLEELLVAPESAAGSHEVQTMRNPAAVYCTDLGYRYEVSASPDGQTGLCRFPDGLSCPGWDFLSGKCGQEHSICARNGLQTMVVSDGKNPFSWEYAVCVDAAGKSVQSATDMAGLLQKALGQPAKEPLLEEATVQPLRKAPDVFAATVPTSFDWRSYDGGNWLTPVRDQGICGSCWAFSAVGVAESVLSIAADNPSLDLDLSEQYLVSGCASAGTCAGGSKGGALDYIRASGIPDEACFPYGDGGVNGCSYSSLGACRSDICTYYSGGACSDYTCSNRCSDWAGRLHTISAAASIGYNPDKNTIKQALIDYGPLAASMTMTGSFDPTTHVFSCNDNDSTGHAVVLVGYNDAGGYWIIRNSWGANYGPNSDGYFYVAYDDCAVQKYLYRGSHPDVPAVPNDDFSNPKWISTTPYSDQMDTSTATTATDDPTMSLCGRGQGYATVWYRFGATTSGTLTVDTVGSGYDTMLAVWTGSRGSLVGIACDDDSGGNLTSLVSVEVEAGTVYHIEVAQYQPASGATVGDKPHRTEARTLDGGSMRLNVAFTPTVPLVPSDDLSSAKQITTAPYADVMDTTGATVAVDDPAMTGCGLGPGLATVWYHFTPGTAGLLALNTNGSTYDTVLAVWTGSRGSLVHVACDDDGGDGAASMLSADLVGGTTYYIEAAQYNSAAAPSEGSKPIGNAHAADGGTLYLSVSYTPSVPVVPNDDFGGPRTITASPYSDVLDTTGATCAADDPLMSQCSLGTGFATVWYEFTPSTKGQLTVDTIGSDYDTTLAVWTGVRGSLTSLGCDDDSGGNLTSRVSLETQASTTYYIEAAQYGWPEGERTGTKTAATSLSGGILHLNVDFVPGGPDNDNFDHAEQINSTPYNDVLDSTWATSAVDDPALSACERGPGLATVWYRFTPNTDGTLAVDTTGSGYDTMLAVWTGSRGSLAHVACNDDYGGYLTSWLSANLVAGTTYYIEAAQYGYAGTIQAKPQDSGEADLLSGGTLCLNVTFTPSVPYAPNDDFDSPKYINSMPYSDEVDTSSATSAPDDPELSLCLLGAGFATVWYRFTPSTSGSLTVDTEESNYDTQLAVWTGSRGSLSCVACADDIEGGMTSQLSLQAAGGTTYFIEAAQYGWPTGSHPGLSKTASQGEAHALYGGMLHLNVSFVPDMPVAPNDDFGSPKQMSSMPYSDAMDTTGATSASDDPAPSLCSLGAGYATVWYRYTPGADGALTVDTAGSNFDTMLAVWTGSRGSLSCVACDDDAGEGFTSLLAAELIAGTTYHIEAMQYGWPSGGAPTLAKPSADAHLLDGGMLHLNASFTPSVPSAPNDDFDTPEAIGVVPYVHTMNTAGATSAADDPTFFQCNRAPGRATVWYLFTPEATGLIEINTNGSTYDTMLGLWTGSRGGLVSIACDDDSGAWLDSLLAAQVQAGTTYYIEVAEFETTLDNAAGKPSERVSALAGGTLKLDVHFRVRSDIDAEGRSDLVVFRPSVAAWFASKSSTDYTTSLGKAWGAPGDVPLSGDLDGDGQMDLIVYRPAYGVWFALTSSTNYDPGSYFVKGWGAPGDIPLSGDLDGDRRMDLVIYRPSIGVWFVLTSSSGYATPFGKAWGASGDIPISGDLDGDGKMDLIVYRPTYGVWFGLTSSTGYSSAGYFVQGWGAPGDQPLSGDIDGDARMDLIVYRPSNGVWFALRSSTNYTTPFGKAWGAGEDVPVSGDLDGDGKMDLIVYRPAFGVWFGLLSSSDYSTSSYFVKGWGAVGDLPLR